MATPRTDLELDRLRSQTCEMIPHAMANGCILVSKHTCSGVGESPNRR